MARLAASLLLAFAFFVTPALCVGGLLEHACDCGHEGEIQCPHEDACSEDPCASFALSTDRDARTTHTLDASWLFATLLTQDAELDSALRSRSSSPSAPPDRSNLPYRLSDRPLLI